MRTEADPYRGRLIMLAVVAVCLFGALFARLTFLQVVDAPASRAVAASTGLRQIYTQAPRGEILDRNGQVLVGNRLSEVITVQRQLATRAGEARLALLAGMSPEHLATTLADTQYNPFTPVPVLADASASEILYVQEHRSLLPGVEVTAETLADYTPAGKAAANIVGYVGAITQAEYASVSHRVYQPGDQVGLTGLEAAYESVLRGTPGVTTVRVNPAGAVLGVVSTTAPLPGENLELTIDGRIQMAAENALLQGQQVAQATHDPVTDENFRSPGGAAVVEDPQNGTILAMATNPVYDPDEFVGGISDADYAKLQQPSAHDPLLDRTIQGEYAPGSTFKLFTAIAALEDGLISPTTTYDDTGQVTIGGQVFHDDGDVGSGVIDLQQAITVSSDTFFNVLGADFWTDRGKLGDTALQDTAIRYGFGHPTGVALPDEDTGLIPTPAIQAELAKKDPKVYGSGKWYTGDSAQIAYGQFEDEVTPLQLANAYSTFANGGTRYVPRLAADAQTRTGQVTRTYTSAVAARVPLPAADQAALLAGFSGVVANSDGTANAVFAGTPLAGKDIAGKTGTAQQQPPDQDTSVFTSFAPADHPIYEVTCFMEQSGYGVSVAAPVARQIYDALYDLPAQPMATVTATGNQT